METAPTTLRLHRAADHGGVDHSTEANSEVGHRSGISRRNRNGGDGDGRGCSGHRQGIPTCTRALYCEVGQGRRCPHATGGVSRACTKWRSCTRFGSSSLLACRATTGLRLGAKAVPALPASQAARSATRGRASTLLGEHGPHHGWRALLPALLSRRRRHQRGSVRVSVGGSWDALVELAKEQRNIDRSLLIRNVVARGLEKLLRKGNTTSDSLATTSSRRGVTKTDWLD